MEDRYRWDYNNAVSLQTKTSAVHNGLNDGLDKLDALIADMEADPQWGGDHRDAFLAWADLLRQFHAGLADPSVGLAAARLLGEFISGWAGYYVSSAVYQSLGRV